MVDHLQQWSKASGLTLEQVADVFDKVNRMGLSSTTDDDPPKTLATMTTKGKH